MGRWAAGGANLQGSQGGARGRDVIQRVRNVSAAFAVRTAFISLLRIAVHQGNEAEVGWGSPRNGRLV